MKQTIHRTASIIAIICIATFFTSTLIVELFASKESIVLVKSLIVIPGLFILVPAMAVTGGSGFALAKRKTGRLVDKKKKRMPFIGAIGLLILMPAAVVLDQWASVGLFDTKFYIVQVIELIAGATNLTLMILNMRDGYKISKKTTKK